MAVYSEDRLEWVTEAVKSMLAQTYQDFSFVIVIDGPVAAELKDYLLDIAQQHTAVLLIENKVNQGLSASMNFVIELGLSHQAQYFFRMDADDISAANRLEKQIAYFEAHADVSVLGTALTEINEKGKAVGKRKLPLRHKHIAKYLPKRCAINHPTVAVRFAVFAAGHRYREELMNTQDYFLWIDLMSDGYKFANLAEKLLNFRRVNDFYKRRGLNKSLNEFKARFYAMKKLKRYSIGNLLYAFLVLLLRLMPSKIVKVAYKLDRFLLAKKVKHH
ncbi:glycosyltransferase [Paraglaciecola aestuariivivens]